MNDTLYEIHYEDEIGVSTNGLNLSATPIAASIYGDGGFFERHGMIWQFTGVNRILESIDLKLASVGAFIDEARCNLYLDNSGQPGTFIAESPSLYKWALGGFEWIKFYFPHVLLKNTTDYFLEISRTKSNDLVIYPRVYFATGGIGTLGRKRDNGVWSDSVSYPFAKINYYKPQFKRDPEINKRAMQFTVDMGKSDIDGKYKEGKCDLTLQNKDNYLNPNEGGNIQLNRRIRLLMIEDYQLLHGCEEIANWLYGAEAATAAPELDDINQIEGDYCLKLGKDGTGSAAIQYNITLPFSFDGTDLDLGVGFKFLDTLDLRVGSLPSSYSMQVAIGQNFSNRFYKNYIREGLNTGWNMLGEKISDLDTIGTPDIEILDYLCVRFFTEIATDLIPLGNILMDRWYLGNHHYLFTGFINRLRPSLSVADKTLSVSISDMFSLLNKKEVSIGLQSTKKVSEIVTTLLEAAAIPLEEYNISDGDQTVLADVTWDDVKVKDKLSKCVEVGQHHNFVDGEGIYQFKDNQWLDYPVTDFTFVLDDMDDCTLEFDMKGISNFLRVAYPTDQWAEEEDGNSIISYGKRNKEIDNELMPSGGAYATGVAKYLIDSLSSVQRGVDITLRNRFPELLDLKIGSIVDVINPLNDTSSVYTVVGMNRKVVNDGNHDLKLRCKKWVSPAPLVEWYDLTPFDISNGTYIVNFVDDFYAIGQGIFITPTAGEIWHVKIYGKIVYRGVGFNLKIYAVDGAGKPTGAALATSNTIISIFPGTQEYVLLFTGAERINLTVNTKYAWTIQNVGDAPFCLGVPSGRCGWTIFGIENDVYSGGFPAWKNIGGVWTEIANQDWYFEVRIKTG